MLCWPRRVGGIEEVTTSRVRVYMRPNSPGPVHDGGVLKHLRAGSSRQRRRNIRSASRDKRMPREKHATAQDRSQRTGRCEQRQQIQKILRDMRPCPQPGQPLQFLPNLCGFAQQRKSTNACAGRSDACVYRYPLSLWQGIHPERVAIEFTCAGDKAINIHNFPRPSRRIPG